MVFNSLQFAVFFPAVLLVYWRLQHRGQNLLLLLASWFFYATFDWRFLGLMLLSTVVDFNVGKALDHTVAEKRRRMVFIVSLAVNLGILGFFKYFNFFIDSGTELLDRLGLHAEGPALRILLPVGISFYTFHGISYTFDVFRKHIEPARHFLDFAVFVAFFPQLVAGPIGRAQIQLPQFENPRTPPTRPEVDSALLLIVTGLFKKVVIADSLAPYVNTAFGSTRTAGWTTLAVGMFGFAFQIYGDFSGYTDIARGTARLLGVELPLNFTQPYLSRNITEFWQRWHISLSSWLRDYLYIPLGGNRGSRANTYRNLMITMLLGGLWHGAAMTFVVWGGAHGALLSLHRWWAGRRDGPPREPTVAVTLLCTIATFITVAAAFVVFRAATFSDAFHLFTGLLRLRPGPVDIDAVTTVVLAGLTLLALDGFQRLRHEGRLPVLRVAPVGAALGLMTTAIVVFSGGTPVPFIYFKF